jgi:hypothetical protein
VISELDKLYSMPKEELDARIEVGLKKRKAIDD